MRVKIIAQRNFRDLEYNINEWLKRNSDLEIIDIKYSSHGGGFGSYSDDHHAAMIIYK